MAAKKESSSKQLPTGPAGDKKAALETALAQIEKQFGKGAVMKLGTNVAMQVDAISTGSLGLDLALGIGGLPRGRIIEVYGPESSGKTTLALHVLAEARSWAARLPLSTLSTPWIPPMPAPLALTLTACWSASRIPASRPWNLRALVRSGAIDAIVVDSVAAMVPKAEIEGEMGDSHVACRPA